MDAILPHSYRTRMIIEEASLYVLLGYFPCAIGKLLLGLLATCKPEKKAVVVIHIIVYPCGDVRDEI